MKTHPEYFDQRQDEGFRYLEFLDNSKVVEERWRLFTLLIVRVKGFLEFVLALAVGTDFTFADGLGATFVN